VRRINEDSKWAFFAKRCAEHGLRGTGPSFIKDPLGFKDLTTGSLAHGIQRVLVALAVWSLGLYCNNISQAWLQKHIGDTHFYPANLTLYDSGFEETFDLSRKIVESGGGGDLCNEVAGLLPILVLIRFCAFPGPCSMRWTVLSRAFLIWGILWFLRGVTIISTVLPNPDKTCEPRISFPDNIWLEAWANLPFIFWYDELTCQDVLFSGHTVGMTVAALMWIRYIAWAPVFEWTTKEGLSSLAFWYKVLVVLYTLFGYGVIIVSHFHYSCDVLIASMLSILVFQAYHAGIRSAFWPRTGRESRGLLNMTILAFIRWFEEKAVDARVLQQSFLPLIEVESRNGVQTVELATNTDSFRSNS
jgi:hypothetical protein